MTTTPCTRRTPTTALQPSSGRSTADISLGGSTTAAVKGNDSPRECRQLGRQPRRRRWRPQHSRGDRGRPDTAKVTGNGSSATASWEATTPQPLSAQVARPRPGTATTTQRPSSATAATPTPLAEPGSPRTSDVLATPAPEDEANRVGNPVSCITPSAGFSTCRSATPSASPPKVPSPPLAPAATPTTTPDDVELATFSWVHWWNTTRLHSAISHLPPDEFETAHSARQPPATQAEPPPNPGRFTLQNVDARRSVTCSPTSASATRQFGTRQRTSRRDVAAPAHSPTVNIVHSENESAAGLGEFLANRTCESTPSRTTVRRAASTWRPEARSSSGLLTTDRLGCSRRPTDSSPSGIRTSPRARNSEDDASTRSSRVAEPAVSQVLPGGSTSRTSWRTEVTSTGVTSALRDRDRRPKRVRRPGCARIRANAPRRVPEIGGTWVRERP